jgi:hypothetical protein
MQRRQENRRNIRHEAARWMKVAQDDIHWWAFFFKIPDFLLECKLS